MVAYVAKVVLVLFLAGVVQDRGAIFVQPAFVNALIFRQIQGLFNCRHLGSPGRIIQSLFARTPESNGLALPTTPHDSLHCCMVAFGLDGGNVPVERGADKNSIHADRDCIGQYTVCHVLFSICFHFSALAQTAKKKI